MGVNPDLEVVLGSSGTSTIQVPDKHSTNRADSLNLIPLTQTTDYSLPVSQSVGPQSDTENLTPLQEVCRAYEEHIGILGPLQVDKLRLWLEDPELAKPVEVVAKAIELASESGNRRINYVEGSCAIGTTTGLGP